MLKATTRSLRFVALALLCCAAASGQEEGSAPRSGVIFFIEGVGGSNLLTVGGEIACRRAGLPHEVRPFRWTHGFGRVFDDLQDIEHVLAKGEELAREIRRRSLDPGARIFLVAHSGGTGIAVRAAELLPPDTIERIVLLSSALSPTYDLRPALAGCRHGIVSYHAPQDFLILGWGTWQFGTIDRKYVASAGREGFRLPDDLSPADQALYSRLVQIPWKASMILDGNLGNHNAPIFPRFLAREVARWLR